MSIKSAAWLGVWAVLVAVPVHAQADNDQDDTQHDDTDSDTDDSDKDGANQRDKGKAPAKDPSKKGDGKQGPANKELGKSKKPGGCVDVTTRARFASVGYDHIVTLKSECKKTMRCSVKTNVNPEPAIVELDPGEEESVVTWRGSPARVFTPEVSCD